MVARAFCELFVAGCLEVKTQEVGGEVRRLYRAVDDVDTALLDRAERAVVRWLRTFRSFEALLELCADEVREGRQEARGEADLETAELGSSRPFGTLRDETAELLAEMGEVIDDALEYLPPACSCSI